MTFEGFLNALLGELSKPNFWQGESYLTYLLRPEAERTNDEADIVDGRITKLLLQGLGYGESEWTYNRTEGTTRRRPDYVVNIAGFPRPPFVVEDKNTATAYLDIHATQLLGYMSSQRCPLGILTDGKEVIAYEQSSQGAVSLVRLPLRQLVEIWAGLSAAHPNPMKALPEDMSVALTSFYNRFSKDAFVGTTRLVEDLIYTKGGDLHNEQSWPSESRISVTRSDQDFFMDSLIADMRHLIEEIAVDVRSQLNLRLTEYAGYGDFLSQIRQEIDGKIQSLNEGLVALGLPPEDIERLLGMLVKDMAGRFDAKLTDRVKRDIERAYASVSRNDSGESEQIAVQQSLGEAKEEAPPRSTKRGRKPSFKPLPEQVLVRLESVGDALARYHLVRDSQYGVAEVASEVKKSFDLWRSKVAAVLLPQAGVDRLIKEYAFQTAYVMVVRMLLVRIVEDKGLISRVFTNGGLALWFKDVESRYLKYAGGKGANFLLEMAYTSAQYIYAHFYSDRLIYDWYVPDRNLVIRVLHRLAGYDLSHISHDIIGHLYSRYVEDEHKHESGMYYTPTEVVEYILDKTGFKGHHTIGKKVLDIAAGSGGFLVSAARRILDAYRDFYHGQIPPENAQEVIDAIRENLMGLDLNPFACYLAETNLLIQVLDLIKAALDAKEDVHIGRFLVYNTDSLRFDPRTIQLLKSSLGFPAEMLPLEEQVKGRLGTYAEGFDLIVGNPPYVRADENDEVISYRNEIKENMPIEEVRDVLYKKWDLFVPFVSLGAYLLCKGGRMGLITSSSLQLVPYAERLRHQLMQMQIDELSFFPGVRLFEDAQVENTIITLTKQTPDSSHEVERLWHSGKPPTVRKTEKVGQLIAGEECFREETVAVTIARTIPLESLCYVTKGMVLNSDEKTRKGEFTKDDLLAELDDNTHPVPYVEGKDIDPYTIERNRWLEYGPGLRAPDGISRSTFSELYDRPKLIAQRSVSNTNESVSQVMLDDGRWSSKGYLYTNESGIIIMPWHLLAGVHNKSIGTVPDRPQKENLSASVNIFFLLGVLNSSWVTNFVKAARTHDIHVFPDVFRKIPVPEVDGTIEKQIAGFVRQLHSYGKWFYMLRKAGWALDLTNAQVLAPTSAISVVPGLKLSQAKVRWQMNIITPDASLSRLKVSATSLMAGRTKAITFPVTTPEDALVWLCRHFSELPEGTTFRLAEQSEMTIAASPEHAAEALQKLLNKEKRARLGIMRFHTIKRNIDQMIDDLYDVRDEE